MVGESSARKSGFRVELTPKGTLRLVTPDGEIVDDAKAALAWPVHHKERYISFINSEGREAAMAYSMDEVAEDCRDLLLKELNRKYLVAVVTKIEVLKMEHDISYWTVETDRGKREFVINESDWNPQRITSSRWRVRDVSGNHFEIPDVTALDKQSRRLLRRFMD